MHGVKVII